MIKGSNADVRSLAFFKSNGLYLAEEGDRRWVAGSAAEELRNPRGFDSSLPPCADTWHDTMLVDMSNLRPVRCWSICVFFANVCFGGADMVDLFRIYGMGEKSAEFFHFFHFFLEISSVGYRSSK